MKILATLFLALVTAVCFGGVPAWAQHGGGGGHGHSGGMPGTPAMSHEAGPGDHGAMGNNPGGTNSKQTPSDILSRNTKLSNKISGLTGLNAQHACQGFKNLGQCVAAAHVGKNLGGSCTFGSLKGVMLAGGSLGKAIHTCDPRVNSKAEARRAERQADRDIRNSSS